MRSRGVTAAIPDRTGVRAAVLSSTGLYLGGQGPPRLLEAESTLDISAAPVWSPNNAKVAYLRTDGVWAHDRRSNDNSRVLTTRPEFNYSFDW